MGVKVNELDPVLTARLLAGDRGAFERLVQCYERPVYAMAYRMLGDAAEAMDVAQCVFLKAYQHLDGYDPKYRLFSWIYRIAVNESLDRLERRKRTGADGEVDIDDARLESDAPEPDALVEAGQVHGLIQVAVMGLQVDYRVVILLRHYSELSYGEIAEILQVPEKTVKSRLYSARQLLRERLGAVGVTTA